MIIRVVEIVVIQRQLSRVIQVVRAAVITRQLLHPLLHQLLHQLQPLHRHQLLSQSQSRMYGIAFGRVRQIIITQLVEVVMLILQALMQACVMHVEAIMFPLAIQRQVLDSLFGY